jgi:hypothetical protein
MKNNNPGKKPSYTSTRPLVYAHKIETRPNWRSAHLFDYDGFHEFRSQCKKELRVRWKSPTQPKSLSRWTWTAISDALCLTVVGVTAHLEDRAAWQSQPFPSPEQLSDELRHWNYIGLLRLSPETSDPEIYTDHIGRFFQLIERWGIHERTREIEIACDTPNTEEGRKLVKHFNLKNNNPLDLVHFRQGHGNKPYPGPSRDGLKEYLHWDTYPANDVFSEKKGKYVKRQNGGRTQLVTYPSKEIRPDTDDIHTELRLGPLRLYEFQRTGAFESMMESPAWPILKRDYSPKVISPTLTLLGLIEPIWRHHVCMEELDIPNLYVEKPESKRGKLKSLSARGQRFKLAKAGLTKKEINRYFIKTDLPSFQVITPGISLINRSDEEDRKPKPLTLQSPATSETQRKIPTTPPAPKEDPRQRPSSGDIALVGPTTTTDRILDQSPDPSSRPKVNDDDQAGWRETIEDSKENKHWKTSKIFPTRNSNVDLESSCWA